MTNYITRGEYNELNFTLNESITLLSPNIILDIEDKVDYNHKYILLDDDYSYNTARFNQYIIEEVDQADEDLAQSKIYLEVGQYNFYVWQCTGTTISTITDSIIESGQFKVS